MPRGVWWRDGWNPCDLATQTGQKPGKAQETSLKSPVLVVDALPLVECQQHTKRNAVRREGMPEVDETVCVKPPRSWSRDFYFK